MSKNIIYLYIYILDVINNNNRRRTAAAATDNGDDAQTE